MPRITELRLPLDHTDEALSAAIRARLGLSDDAPLTWSVARRGYDARRQGRYPAGLFDRRDGAGAGGSRSAYRSNSRRRLSAGRTRPCPPRVTARGDRHRALRSVRRVGSGGDGISSDHRGTRPRSPRTHARYLGTVAARHSAAGKQCAVRRRRCRDLFGWETLQRDQGGARPWPQGAHRVCRGRRPRGNSVEQQAAYRHVPACHDRRRDPRQNRGAWRRIPVRSESHRHRHRHRPRMARGRSARWNWKAAKSSQTIRIVLAIGHSARDTFQMLHERGVFMEPKPFSIGVRIEHPQSLIDHARFGRFAGHPNSGAADYKLVHHAKNGRSVYSFCMCPGGQVVAATSETGAGGDEWHEPIFAGRIQCECRNCRRDHAGRLSGRTAGGNRISASLGIAGIQGRWRRLFRSLPARRRLSGGARIDRFGRRRSVLSSRVFA